MGDRLAPTVVLYSRAGCHLCEQAREVVVNVVGPAFREVDVDTDPQLVRRYGEDVPVLVVDGREVARWRVDEQRLRRAIDPRPRGWRRLLSL